MLRSRHPLLVSARAWLAGLAPLAAAGCPTYAGPRIAPEDTSPVLDAGSAIEDAALADAPIIAADAAGVPVTPPPVGTICRPHRVIPTMQAAIPYQGSNGRVDPVCSVDVAGVVTMTYQPLDCSDPQVGWWAGCTFAANQDLSAFDDETGPGRGIIAMTVCVSDFVPSALNLRYGSPELSSAGRTKFMAAIAADEQFTGTGCRLVYLSPFDACYSFDRCGPVSGCAPATDSSGPTCDSFASSQLTIMNEFCRMSATAPTQPSTVTVEQVTYYQENCLCATDAECPFNEVCRRDGWPAGAKCNPPQGFGCPGVCAP